MVLAAILAGGTGRRFGSQIPKQFLELGGEPVLVRSLRAFAESWEVHAAVVTVPEGWEEEASAMIDSAALSLKADVIAGGATRALSLKRALDFLAEKYGREDHVVLTHDAARPFVSGRIIRDNVRAALEYGAANTCVPATDTVFLSEDGRFMDSGPPRSTVYHCQTPQTFLLDRFLTLVEGLDPETYAAMTDGTSVCLACGVPVALVEGEPENVKITYPGDLAGR